MIKQVCICSRCGKEETKEAYEIKVSIADVGLVNRIPGITVGTIAAVDYGTHLCKDCKAEFDNFMNNEKEFVIPEKLMNEDILRALAVEGCPEEFDLPQIKTVCEETGIEECVECFKKAIKIKEGE